MLSLGKEFSPIFTRFLLKNMGSTGKMSLLVRWISTMQHTVIRCLKTLSSITSNREPTSHCLGRIQYQADASAPHVLSAPFCTHDILSYRSDIIIMTEMKSRTIISEPVEHV